MVLLRAFSESQQIEDGPKHIEWRIAVGKSRGSFQSVSAERKNLLWHYQWRLATCIDTYIQRAIHNWKASAFRAFAFLFGKFKEFLVFVNCDASFLQKWKYSFFPVLGSYFTIISVPYKSCSQPSYSCFSVYISHVSIYSYIDIFLDNIKCLVFQPDALAIYR